MVRLMFLRRLSSLILAPKAKSESRSRCLNPPIPPGSSRSWVMDILLGQGNGFQRKRSNTSEWKIIGVTVVMTLVTWLLF